MSKPPPVTLLDHPASIEGDKFKFDPRAPEDMRAFAKGRLVKRGVTSLKAVQAAMGPESTDPVVPHAAWLWLHSTAGLKIISELPQEYRDQLRTLWAHAFHAGARHETITANFKHLRDVQAQHRRRNDLPALARAARKEPFTPAQYKAALLEARSRKELFGLLRQSGRVVRNFEFRHPELKTK